MNIAPGHAEEIPAAGNPPRQLHVFDADSISAIDAALAAQRPLLLRGEPGIGKSQLDRAAALVLRRAYVQQVVDARTEFSDLLWTYDAVARLAEAQLQGALGSLSPRERSKHRRRLSVSAYVSPEPFWWAFDWEGAGAQARVSGGAEPLPPDAGDPRRRELARARPLAEWHDLLPMLRCALARPTETRALDVPRIVRRLGRGEAMPRLRRRPRWGLSLHVIEDRSDHLVPYWADQSLACHQLARLFPGYTVEHALWYEGLREPVWTKRPDRPYRLPPPGSLVIVLNDLGCLLRGGET